jgi:hypothetical protein
MQLTLDFSFVKIESIFYKIKSLCYLSEKNPLNSVNTDITDFKKNR